MAFERGCWRYADTLEPVAENPERTCGHCLLNNRLDGHDACLGCLPGVANACCGHGNEQEAYVQLSTGQRLSGKVAKDEQDRLRKIEVNPQTVNEPL